MSITQVQSKIIYDSLKTLIIVENNADLLEIFQEDIKIEIPLLKLMAEKGSLSNNIEALLEAIFNSIILNKQRYIDEYSLIEGCGTGHKSRKVLPRRYGKVQILQDIEKSGNKPTDLQRAMLAINDLRNIYVSLTNKCITDYFNESKKLDDTHCRDISAAVASIKKKLTPILKK